MEVNLFGVGTKANTPSITAQRRINCYVEARKEKENWQAWVKRKCCDKSCAATAKIRRVRPTIIIVPVPYQQRVHVKQYIPGTPEFKQIAALYGG